MSIAPFLLGQTRAAVLGVLFLHPELSVHVRELARMVGASAGSLHRDLRAMTDEGLLVRQEIGRQVHYKANAACPVFEELAGLLRKTSGLVDVIRDALVPLNDQIDGAFIYGSMARGQEHAHSDVDVMVIGKADFADVAVAVSEAQGKLGREINPTVFSPSDFRKRLRDGHGFVQKVWSGDKLWLMGSQEALNEP
jgi:predicted nucleotidyltransferase